MQLSELKETQIAEAKIISSVLNELPNEINGGLVASILVTVLLRYDMSEEWDKIVDVVNETLENIGNSLNFTSEEVRVN